MIFDRWMAVLTGVQTQTRRLVQPGEDLAREDNWDQALCWPHRVVNAKGKIVYMPIKRYPIQPRQYHPPMIYNPDHPCYGIDVIEPGDNHYRYAKEGTWGYQGQGYRDAFIHITDIRREDVRDITHEDALAEGFNSRIDFLKWWVAKHDPKMNFDCTEESVMFFSGSYRYYANRRDKWITVDLDTLLNVINERPAQRYDAWVLDFELVKE